MQNHPDNRFLDDKDVILIVSSPQRMVFTFRGVQYDRHFSTDDVGLPYAAVGDFRIYPHERMQHARLHIEAAARKRYAR